jgi:hypothetical protein
LRQGNRQTSFLFFGHFTLSYNNNTTIATHYNIISAFIPISSCQQEPSAETLWVLPKSQLPRGQQRHRRPIVSLRCLLSKSFLGINAQKNRADCVTLISTGKRLNHCRLDL